MDETIIESERLFLRKWKESDAEELYSIAKNEKVALPCGWMPHESVENSLMLIQTILGGENIYAICLKENGKAIGSTGFKIGKECGDFCEDDTQGEIGYWLGEEFWGNGYTTEIVKELVKYGFEELNLTKLWCNHFEGNAGSKAVKDKLGFKYIKTEKDHKAERINKIIDLHVGCLTRDQWQVENK